MPIGDCWATGSWVDGAWADNAWADGGGGGGGASWGFNVIFRLRRRRRSVAVQG